ncbi:hypothetical protein [Mucilaginibacter sp.]|uniref:hypothetical protein n=1 Tax=Mucilaginibacter sp. TaxID=1882438 RepID=UPI003266EF68
MVTNYSDIFNIVAKYYPIGIENHDPCYNAYYGSTILRQKIEEMLNSEESKSKWKRLVASMKNDFPDLLYININSPLLNVCYSAEFSIKTEICGNFTHTLKLCCHLSYLGPYFCMYGKEDIIVDRGVSSVKFDPVIIASPTDYIDVYFKRLRQTIMQEYFDYQLLPFAWLNKRVKGLTVDTSDLKEYQYSSVFQALFGKENITDYKIIGNEFYK